MWTNVTEQSGFERAEESIFEKTVQKQATLRNVLGKRNGFGPLFGPLFGHFFDKIVNFFDVVVTWYSDPSGDFAPLPCTVYLVQCSKEIFQFDNSPAASTY